MGKVNGYNHGAPKGSAWIGKTAKPPKGDGKKGGGVCGLLVLAFASVPAAFGFAAGYLAGLAS